MKVLLITAFLAVASATVVKDDRLINSVNWKENLVNLDIKTKELCIMRLLNHILQPTVYTDIKEVAREWVIEDNVDKYLKVDVVKDFIELFKMGMLPRGEMFVHSNEVQLKQAIKVFRLLYFAKDFDVFLRTACWLRERINGGMFVYALTVAVFHRTDCRGIIMPPPYEIYPYVFVDSHIINKAFMLKMTHAARDPAIFNYYGIKVTDKNLVIIDWRKGLRYSLNKEDKLSYFTEDIDLNTFMYYRHMIYPFWMTGEEYGLNKERWGEVLMYTSQQLLARMKLERMSREMCSIKPLKWEDTKNEGYWPKLRLHTGDEIPVRSNNVKLITSHNLKEKTLLDDVERIIRLGIMTGRIHLRDGTVVNLNKVEDFENLSRMLVGMVGVSGDDAKVIHIATLFKKILSYSIYNVDKYTYVPTALDMYSTCLRDPLFWRLMKRVVDNAWLFKTLLPKYTRQDFDFPGVKIEHLTTDKLVTFIDDYDLDITNALYLDESEIKKMRSDMVYVARMRRLNNHPFKINIEVLSDKAVDAVVRVFIGPKFDCMGRLLGLNDKRDMMVEIDSFLYKLDTGKNTIVRNSIDMHGVLQDRPWTRRWWDYTWTNMDTQNFKMVDSWWWKSRVGFPNRLLLPLGRRGGLPMQLYVIVSPVRMGMVLPSIDVTIMRDRRTCFWSTCIDTMPLGYPFDRYIDVTQFFTTNMKFQDIEVYRKDLTLSNNIKDVDWTDMVMRRDDLTFMDTDMLVRWSYKDVMMTTVDNMTRM